jgi:transcriptional regulator with XRE-family HTH domain
MRQFRVSQLTVPANAHPLVKALFREMVKQRVTISDMADRSGIGRNAISKWRYCDTPTIINIEACFNVLGFELKPKKIVEKSS